MSFFGKAEELKITAETAIEDIEDMRYIFWEEGSFSPRLLMDVFVKRLSIPHQKRSNHLPPFCPCVFMVK